MLYSKSISLFHLVIDSTFLWLHGSSSIFSPMKPHFALPALILSLSLGVQPFVTHGKDAALPNIILILADDMGWTGPGCYGSDLHQTPNIDKLASSGVRFTNAYAASPVCTPTRASVMMGRYPARQHITIWRESAKNRGNRKLLEPVAEEHIAQSSTTIAEVLSAAGYYCAHIGKWHLGTARDYPEVHGFDINIGGTLWGAPQTFFYPFTGSKFFGNEFRYVPDLEPGGKPGDYLTDRLTDKALELIDQFAGKRPLFLNLSYYTVHTPIEGKPELTAAWKTKLKPDLHHKNPDYAAMVQSLDENVGRVLARIEEKGIAENTIVVFFSDNGGYIGNQKKTKLPVTDNSPLRSGKGSLYEGGVRIPFIVKWPGNTPEGAVTDEPIFTCDLYPTILKMTGLSGDAKHNRILDGIDLTPLLKNPNSKLPERTLYFHYPHYYSTTNPASSLREGDWKLIDYYDDTQPVELYNLSSDLGELTNLANKNPKTAKRLQQKLHRWLDAINAQRPELNPEYKSRKKKK